MWKVAEAIQGQEKLAPVCMTTQHRSNIFTLDFTCDNSFVFSGGGAGWILHGLGRGRLGGAWWANYMGLGLVSCMVG